jgi:hypothetical protein
LDLERAKGIEPSYAAWEAAVLPLNYARKTKALARTFRRFSRPVGRLFPSAPFIARSQPLRQANEAAFADTRAVANCWTKCSCFVLIVHDE